MKRVLSANVSSGSSTGSAISSPWARRHSSAQTWLQVKKLVPSPTKWRIHQERINPPSMKFACTRDTGSLSSDTVHTERRQISSPSKAATGKDCDLSSAKDIRNLPSPRRSLTTIGSISPFGIRLSLRTPASEVQMVNRGSISHGRICCTDLRLQSVSDSLAAHH